MMHRLLLPFNQCLTVCLLLAGWALWTAGLLDGEVARQVRTSSVYAAPGIDLDQAEAERILGNRRLVVVLLDDPGLDLAAGCKQVRRAADGNLVLLLRPGEEEYDRYGCGLMFDLDDTRDFGRALVAETTVSRGINGYVDQPLMALKMIALNYDRLVRAGTLPDGARTISPSLPRYLIATAAILTVTTGAAVAYLGARRAGRLTAQHLARREASADRRHELCAATGVLAQQILDLDQQVPGPAGGGRGSATDGRYRELATRYATLLDAVTTVDRHDPAAIDELAGQVAELSEQCRRISQGLAGKARRARS